MTDSKASTAIYTLMIINKSGSLIFNKDFSGTSKLGANDFLRLASTFHSLHAISARGVHTFTSQADPAAAAPATPGAAAAATPNIGIISLEARDFRLQCYQALTGVKFLMTAASAHPSLDKVLQQVYVLYTDYVLKNPFFELDMPIRCELFDQNILRLVSSKPA